MKSIIFYVAMLISAVCQAAPTAAQHNVVLIGDSISSSVPFGDTKNLWANLVAAERNVVLKNISSPGAALGLKDYRGFNNQSTIDSIDRIGGAWSAYSFIIVQAGTNDYGLSVPLNDTIEGLSRILKHARNNKKKVLVLEPIWRNGEEKKNKIGLTLNHYRFVMVSLCVNDYKDVCKAAFRQNTVMGNSASAMYFNPAEVKAKIQLHPDTTGNRHMANWVKQAAAKAGFF